MPRLSDFSTIGGVEDVQRGETNAAISGNLAGGAFGLEQARQQSEWARLLGDELMGAGREFSGEAMANSRYFMDRYKNIFAPNEDRLAKDVAGYDSPEEMERVRQEAAGNANQAFDTAQRSRGVELARMGVNPNSGRYAAPGSDDLNRTIATSDSMNRATAGRSDAAIGLRGNLANFGTGVAQTGGTFAAQGAGYLNAAANAASGIRTAPANWLNAATGAYASAGGMATARQNAMTNMAMARNDARGKLMGGLSSMFSSKKAKDRVGRVIEGEVVKKIKSMPVDRWRYKKEIVADEAAEGGQREHVGPYAEDFKKRFGVGDGRTISFIDAHGVAFAAIKGLAKEVDKLKAARA
jgi:hypothetical protein